MRKRGDIQVLPPGEFERQVEARREAAARETAEGGAPPSGIMIVIDPFAAEIVWPKGIEDDDE